MNQPKIVLGLTGKFCAGKGAVANYLVDQHGFLTASFSDRIREEIINKGQEVTRENLQGTAGKMRQKYGPMILAERTMEHIEKLGAEKAVVETIRSTAEVEFLKKYPNFFLVAVDADAKIRFERMKDRKREKDPQTWEEFLAFDERDIHQDGRNIDECIKMADFVLINEGTPEELEEKVAEMLKKLVHES